MPESHQPITFENIKGLYRRGVYVNSSYFQGEDETPANHLCDGLNFQFYGNSFGTRYGALKLVNFATPIVRYAIYRRLGEASRIIILDNTGKFYDSTNLASPILNIPTATDFSGLNLYNSFFISPHNGTNGLAGEFVYVYNGTSARAALGVAPVGAITLADGSAGSVETGQHLISVAYETASGFITPPITPQLYTAPGSKRIHVTNIPIGPAGTSARRLIATKVITYNGNPTGFALFFVPNGRIADNVTTTLNIDFFDADLFDSADYLLDELSSLPAAVGMINYKGRLVTFGENGQPNTARVSKINEPESFSSTSGLLTIDPTEAGGVTNAIEFRSILYLTKNTKTYATQDNGSDPDTWEVPPATDKGIGTTCHGISQIFNDRGANLDAFIVADQSGLCLFNGTYQHPELSYKVEEIWSRINRSAFNKIQVFNDVQNRILYCLVPLDGATVCNFILVGNYLQGLNYQDIRWSLWQFPTAVNSIGISVDTITSLAYFTYTGNVGHVYNLVKGQLNDFGTSINCFVKFYLAQIVPGWIHHFYQVVLRVWGSGTLNVSAIGEDAVVVTNGSSIILASPAGKESNSRFNHQNEKGAIKLQVNNGSDWFMINRAVLYAKALWNNRPQ